MKANFKNIIFFLLLVVVFIVAAMSLSDMMPKEEEFTYSDLENLFDYGLVKSFVLDTENYLTIVSYVPVTENGQIVFDYLYEDEAETVIKMYQDGTPVKVARREMEDGKAKTKTSQYRISWEFQIDKISERASEQNALGLIEKYNIEEPKDTPWFLVYLPYIIVFGAIIAFYVYMIRQTTGRGGGRMNSFSRAKTKLGSNEKNPIKFRDVAGADEEKEELQEVVEFLRNPQKFVRLGARIPRGVLLVGPPGTGKTLLAKAVAGEAGVPFYSISGSDFVEMYVGVGASRVRDLFETARRNPASIIFIDEIDAVGRHRGAGLGGGHDEREQTLNQLLVEMDGFGNQEGVIVMAATNRPDILDPALLRPGRFDRQITVNYPDLRGREEILRVHVRNKPLQRDVDLHKIAQTTVGFTGADLANLLNEAALLAARRGKSLIGMQEIEEATLKVIVGTDKKKTGRTVEDTRLTAYHEAGHAVVAHNLPGQDPVTRISIIPTSKGAGGYTLTPPVKDQAYELKKHMEADIAVSLGGRVAEQLVFHDYSGGASSDIKMATRVARRMITVYGMSDELGTVCLAGEHSGDEIFLGRDFSAGQSYSQETAAKIDREIKRIIDDAFQVAQNILQANLDKLHRVAEFLLQYEVMDEAQFKALMDENATIEELAAMIKQREDKNRRENEQAEKERTEKEREEAEKQRDTYQTDPLKDFLGEQNPPDDKR
ncbi:MAG: ATP-dependent zinc metalloprotease FtsH [Eubacteriales bacterium]